MVALTLKVGDLGRLSGVSVRSLHHYHEIGQRGAPAIMAQTLVAEFTAGDQQGRRLGEQARHDPGHLHDGAKEHICVEDVEHAWRPLLRKAQVVRGMGDCLP